MSSAVSALKGMGTGEVNPKVTPQKNLATHLQLESGNDLVEQQYLPIGAKTFVEGWRLVIVIVSLCLGTLPVALDTTIIFVAIPRISTSFHLLGDTGWYGSAYLFTTMAFQAGAAKIFKHFIVKATYLVSIMIFEGSYRFIGRQVTSQVGLEQALHRDNS